MIIPKLPGIVDEEPKLWMELLDRNVVQKNIICRNVVQIHLEKRTIGAMANGRIFGANFQEKRQMPFGDGAEENFFFPVDAFAYHPAGLIKKLWTILSLFVRLKILAMLDY